MAAKRSIARPAARLAALAAAIRCATRNAAARWIAALPTARRACRSSAKRSTSSRRFPARGASIGPAQVEALLRIDARLEPIISAAHAAIHGELPELERRRDAAVARRVRSGQGVHRRLPGGAARRATPRGEQKRWKSGPAAGAGAARALQGHSTASSGCSATATGFPRSGANSTSSTNSRGCAAGSASSSCYGAGSFAQPGVSLEQEYIRDAAADAPRQRQLHAGPGRMGGALARGLDAVADARRRRRGRARISTSTSRARRACGGRTGRAPAGGCMFLDATPVYARVVERMRWLPEQDDGGRRAGRRCRRASRSCC